LDCSFKKGIFITNKSKGNGKEFGFMILHPNFENHNCDENYFTFSVNFFQYSDKMAKRFKKENHLSINSTNRINFNKPKFIHDKWNWFLKYAALKDESTLTQ